jgi:exosortase A-associated hydrolase 2
MTEEPLFIPHEGSQLFGVLHAPEASRSGGVGVVFCEAFAEEKLWSQRSTTSFARRLAERGFWVLRFDCRGHGDSGGEFEDATVETRLSDIARAVAFLRERAAVSSVGLHGLRFGGTLAALAARDVDAGFLVLWNPVLEGERYFLECLRSNVATQLATYRKVLVKREHLLRELDSGRPVNIDGYLVPPAFYHQIAKIDLLQGIGSFANPVFLAQVAPGEGVGLDKELQGFSEALRSGGAQVWSGVLRGAPFWKETRWYITSSEPLFSETLEWLDGVRGGGGDGRGESGLLP